MGQITKAAVQRQRSRLPALVAPLSRQAGADATMDIGGWLRGLGLEQYEAAFRDNEIDGEVLPKLTAGRPQGYRCRHRRPSSQDAVGYCGTVRLVRRAYPGR